jgi:hypothetical protein
MLRSPIFLAACLSLMAAASGCLLGQAGNMALEAAAANADPEKSQAATPAATTAPEASTAASAAPTTSAATAAPAATDAPSAPAATATSNPPVVDPAFVEKDLSKAGAAFQGWVAKGPADADVTGDLDGVRIVTNKVYGPGSFDLAFTLRNKDLAKLKKDMQEGSEIAKTKVTFTVDRPDALEWTTAAGKSKSYSFALLQKSSGKDVTCYTVTPRPSEAEVKALKEVCRTLAKK